MGRLPVFFNLFNNALDIKVFDAPVSTRLWAFSPVLLEGASIGYRVISINGRRFGGTFVWHALVEQVLKHGIPGRLDPGSFSFLGVSDLVLVWGGFCFLSYCISSRHHNYTSCGGLLKNNAGT